jgi:hypothetical protein
MDKNGEQNNEPHEAYKENLLTRGIKVDYE